MRPHARTTVNRSVLGVAGLGLFLAGAWLAGTDRAVVPRLPSWWPALPAGSVLLDGGELTRLRAEGWWTPTVIAGATILTVLFTWWTLAQLQSGPARRLALTSGGTVRPQTLAEALSSRAAALPGVARCWATVLPRGRDRLEVGLRVWLAGDTPPGTVLTGLYVLTRETEGTLAPYTVRTRVRFSAVRHRAPHVR